MKQLTLPISEEFFNSCEFFVTSCNEEAYNFLISNYDIKNIPLRRVVLSGPKSSGKSRLGKLWCGNGLYINCRVDNLDIKIISQNQRVVIDNFELADEIELFHTINNCTHNGVVLLLICETKIQLKLPDLCSRIYAAYHLQIVQPDVDISILFIREMCLMNKIKVKQSTIDYIKTRIKFSTFTELIAFRIRLQRLCEDNNMTLNTTIFERIYDNRSWL